MKPILQTFLELVAIDSPPYQEAIIARHLASELTALGLSTEFDEAGNLYAHLEGSGKPILLNAHMDTVEPAKGANAVVEHGIVRTDGTTALGADDKAAIAAILWALAIIKEKQLTHPPLVVLFTTAEEVGLAGARKLDPSMLQGIEYGYTFDASKPVGMAITAAPSHDMIEATFIGKGAHAGFKPEDGISAIQMASRAVDRMKLLRIDEETTANVGSFVAPGAKNIVCDTAQLVFEARSLDEGKLKRQISSMLEALQKAAHVFGGSVEIKHEHLYYGYRHATESVLLDSFKKACERLSLPCSFETTLGGSDANVLNRFGIPTLTCSAGYEDAHTKFEHIPIIELERLGSLVLELATL